ncbi:4'-phosphopantetheinyl transferase family protein [Caldalkalibacillus thermarum]|uniref:4'-phosphopantetheinyl transferase family protein n=1 Tax=Caldalkalibacillus thermarum TaxID=296745 RepID=UPI001E5F18EC|nr:4'-phosphopantetheinyl transferase superfamily protein [Caldalkalibacillus thermarum]
MTGKDLAKLYDCLSELERRQSMKLIDKKQMKRYVAAHGLLRIVLSAYVTIEPKQISISRTPFGKPVLTDYRHIHFNLSHSHHFSYIAISYQGRQVGIDCETVRDVNHECLAKFVFNPSQYLLYKHLDSHIQRIQFFSMWTQKEAFIKAIGLGFQYRRIKDIQVDINISQSSSVTNTWKGKQWVTVPLKKGPEHSASFCYENGRETKCKTG